MIARGSHDAGFVLHLDKDHGPILLVDFPDMLHQGCEGLAVGLQGRCPMRRKRIRRLSVPIQRLWESRGVGRDPVGEVGGLVALPRAEPEHNGPESVRANVADDPVDRREVELALLGLDQLPWNWKLDGVRVVRLEAGQHLGHFFRDEHTVVDLSPQHKERLAIDQQAVPGALLDQLWNWPALRERKGSGSGQDQRQRGEFAQHGGPPHSPKVPHSGIAVEIQHRPFDLLRQPHPVLGFTERCGGAQEYTVRMAGTPRPNPGAKERT